MKQRKRGGSLNRCPSTEQAAEGQRQEGEALAVPGPASPCPHHLLSALSSLPVPRRGQGSVPEPRGDLVHRDRAGVCCSHTHRMGQEREHRGSSGPNSPLKEVHRRAHGTELRPDRSGISPMRTLHTLPGLVTAQERSSSSCSVGIPCASVSSCYPLSHCWAPPSKAWSML